MEKGSSSKSSRKRRGVIESVLRQDVSQNEHDRGLGFKDGVDSFEASSSGRKGYLLRDPSRRSRKLYDDEEYVVDDYDDDDDDDEEYGVDRKGKKTVPRRRNSNTRREHNRRKRELRARDSGNMIIGETHKITVLSWLIDVGAVELNGQVAYKISTDGRTLLEGRVAREGILCMCCCRNVTVKEFEAHAGRNSGVPCQHIFTGRNISLFQCQVDAWNNMGSNFYRDSPIVEYLDDPNDDTCGICADGGNLMCCDGCPATYHSNCLGMEDVPPGNWYCPLCQCKYCGLAGFDSLPEMMECCLQCEQKFHVGCIPAEDYYTNASSRGLTFCGQKCRQLFNKLHHFIGVKHNVGQGITWSLCHSLDNDKTALQHSLYERMQCNAVLAATLSVMEECFAPIVDPRTGINLMRSIICNRGWSLNRLNFSGFYTAVLQSNDEIISVASIRIHGTKMAEMPFIGTRNIYRRQGMCRCLLHATEIVLCSLGVEKLIIPSISERVDSWIHNYNFRLIEEPLKRELRSMNLLTFPKTVQLQKVLLVNIDDDTSANKTVILGHAKFQVNRSRRAPLPFDLNLLPPNEAEVTEVADDDLSRKDADRDLKGDDLDIKEPQIGWFMIITECAPQNQSVASKVKG